MRKVRIAQFYRFLIIGVCAAALHLASVILFVQMLQMNPLHANIGGFLLAFQVSYWGHRAYTFSDTIVLHRVAFPKLLFLQITNLIINEYLFYCFLTLHLPYPLALFIVLTIMPVLTFAISKKFVFT